jgi:hypothetical protein
VPVALPFPLAFPFLQSPVYVPLRDAFSTLHSWEKRKEEQRTRYIAVKVDRRKKEYFIPWVCFQK